MFENADDYDFTPTEGSKLASLFNTPLMQGEDINHSLMYTAPKQPKSTKQSDTSDSSKNKSQTSVLCAKVITLWKLIENKYELLGKHGLAIIGSSVQSAYEIIVYKEKNNILIRVKVNNYFSLLNQNDNFSTFYDSSSQNWLLKFDNSLDQKEFSSEIERYGGNVEDSLKQPPQKDDSTTEPSEAEGNKEVVATSESPKAQTRADILSRMAKMGQQILPEKVIKNISTDLSDSELDDYKLEKKVAPRKVKRVNHSYENKSENNQQISPVTPQQIMSSPTIPNQMLFPQYDNFSFVVAQNAELKIHLAQITSKLDVVLSKVNSNNVSTTPCSDNDGTYQAKIKALELRTENLNSELEKFEKKHSELLKNYLELQNKQHENESNSQNTVIIQQQNEEIDTLKLDISSCTEKCDVYQSQIKTLIEEKDALTKVIDIQNLKLKDFEEFYEANKNNNTSESIETLNSTISNLKLKLKDFEDYFDKHKEEKHNRLKKDEDRFSEVSEVIKKHMNNMFQSLAEHLESNNDYKGTVIQSGIGKSIKSTTYKIIQELQDICVEETKNME